jgi:hypothetical protein
MTPERYNAIRGYAFAVMVMDLIRQWHANGIEVNMWKLTKHIAADYKLDKGEHDRLYHRMKRCIRGLKASGSITTESRWIPEQNIHTKIITPCSATSEK